MRRLVRLIQPEVATGPIRVTDRIYAGTWGEMIQFLAAKHRLSEATIRDILFSAWAYKLSEVVRYGRKFNIPGVGALSAFKRTVEGPINIRTGETEPRRGGYQLTIRKGPNSSLKLPLEDDEEDAGPDDGDGYGFE